MTWDEAPSAATLRHLSALGAASRGLESALAPLVATPKIVLAADASRRVRGDSSLQNADRASRYGSRLREPLRLSARSRKAFE